ncbi:potassium channel family protein [Streptomyces sp. NBC_00555]|uniref:potassium channel family protein n=1 Tax=Streptomyces sp. NBC_00555 TaxID=2903662 RepID=UPI0022579795|nr:potassium channel family protein [Streptomyces sp. NBC_00555]MCX5013009.1 potassium channel family protein [Streptomyces sp. NBC_00555]
MERNAVRRRRRAVAAHTLRSVAWVVLITAFYYLTPLDHGFGVATVVSLVIGLGLFGWLIAWQVSVVTRAEYPRLRAIEVLATAVPLFLVLFSATYYLLAGGVPGSFSESLNRTDALYFTVTVFATVGFGDIVPTTGVGRVLTTLQMVSDLIVVGVIAKVLFGAVQIGVRRRGTPEGGDS